MTPQRITLEGSIAVTGSLIQWLRDNLADFGRQRDRGVRRHRRRQRRRLFRPGVLGLFAPRWRPDARGVIVGLTRYVNKGHIARAALEASAFQTREVIEAMQADSGVTRNEIKKLS